MVAKTPAQRQHEYKVRNSKAVNLSKLRFVVKTSNRIKNDPAFAEELRRKECERKRKYRAKKKEKDVEKEEDVEKKEDFEKEEDVEKEEPAPKKSRQAMVGLLKRKKTNREKNYSISNLLHGKRDMEKELDKMK